MLNLKRHPTPQTPLFEAQDDPVVAPSDTETQAFVAGLRANGVAVIDLGDEARPLCDQVIRDTEHYFEAGASRVQDAWYRSRAIRRLAAWPRMRELLTAAYGRDPFPFQTLNFQRGSQQALHADTVHFHSKPERFMCGVWIALEDVTPGSGPLIYHPGSHRLPVMTMQDAGVNRPDPNYDDYGRAYVPRFAQRVADSGLPEARALLKKGSALVWAANLAHGGAPIETEGSTRRSLVVHNYFEGCVYYTPMTSDETSGRLTVRVPPNIRTGGWTWPKRDGQPVWPGLRTLAATTVHGLLRRPRSY